jgi:hypothetical protein
MLKSGVPPPPCRIERDTLQVELPSIDVADTLLDERRELTEWAATQAGTFHSSRDE